MILPMAGGRNAEEQTGSERIQVMIHVQAEVLDPGIARRRANVWLTMNAGHLLMVMNPELVLEEPLQWRFDVMLSVPQLDAPGTAAQKRIGQIRLNAHSGEVIDATALVEELRANAAEITLH